MERGFEQFIVVAVIILAALLDLLVRSLRRKRQQGPPAERDGEPVLVEDVDPVEEEPVWYERERIDVEPERPPVPAPPDEAVAAAPQVKGPVDRPPPPPPAAASARRTPAPAAPAPGRMGEEPRGRTPGDRTDDHPRSLSRARSSAPGA